MLPTLEPRAGRAGTGTATETLGLRARQVVTLAVVTVVGLALIGSAAVLVALDRRRLALWTGHEPPARRIH